jgi:23S rRNA (cytidine1920-2'-O)/16S rRNA (cytidine1409-2'-O)-methyltransferase
MINVRLDQLLVQKALVSTRSQAESYIKLGLVEVDGKLINKPGYFVEQDSKIKINQKEQYVSRAALKLEGAAKIFNLNFDNAIVLDVGSSTGGFTDYVLRHGAKKVIAVDVGTNQLHQTLINNPKIELHEQTDILDVGPWILDDGKKDSNVYRLSSIVDYILVDVSFVSLRKILPHLATLATKNTLIVAMLKPQFEAGDGSKHKGVIKNDAMRRAIIKDFEAWLKFKFVIIDKADSLVAGSKGNQERFYHLKKK